jgi:hypothetical protein
MTLSKSPIPKSSNNLNFSSASGKYESILSTTEKQQPVASQNIANSFLKSIHILFDLIVILGVNNMDKIVENLKETKSNIESSKSIPKKISSESKLYLLHIFRIESNDKRCIKNKEGRNEYYRRSIQPD